MNSIKGQVHELAQRRGWDMDAIGSPIIAATGVPLEIRPSDRTPSRPIVTYVKPTTGNHSDHTVGSLTGTGDSASLTPSGSRYMQLLSDSF